MARLPGPLHLTERTGSGNQWDKVSDFLHPPQSRSALTRFGNPAVRNVMELTFYLRFFSEDASGVRLCFPALLSTTRRQCSLKKQRKRGCLHLNSTTHPRFVICSNTHPLWKMRPRDCPSMTRVCKPVPVRLIAALCCPRQSGTHTRFTRFLFRRLRRYANEQCYLSSRAGCCRRRGIIVRDPLMPYSQGSPYLAMAL